MNKAESATLIKFLSLSEENVVNKSTSWSSWGNHNRTGRNHWSYHNDWGKYLSKQPRIQNMKAIELSKIMPFSKELVGIWTSKRKAFNIELVICQYSSGKVLRCIDKGGKYLDSFQIQQVELVDNQLYRSVGGANLGVIGYDGLGGKGKDGVPLKYDLGFALRDGRFQPVAWQLLMKNLTMQRQSTLKFMIKC